MTLLIYLPCKDGCVLISDRKESEDVGGSPVDKIFLSRDSSAAIAGAGDSPILDNLHARFFADDSWNASNIEEKFSEKVQAELSNSSGYLPQNQTARFIILARQTSSVKLLYARITSGHYFIDTPSTNMHFAVGEGQNIVNHFLRHKQYQNFTLKEAIAYGVALLQEVQPLIPSVGSLEDYGFSIVAYSSNQEVLLCMDFRLNAPRMTFSLQAEKFDMGAFTVRTLASGGVNHG
jgi:hypothetical protein